MSSCTSHPTRSVSPCLRGLHPHSSDTTLAYTTTTTNVSSASSSLAVSCGLTDHFCLFGSGCSCCHLIMVIYLFISFFKPLVPQHHDKHHFIEKDWKGLKSPVDAVMAGRMYVPPWRSSRRRNDFRLDQQWGQQQGQQWNQQYQQYGQQWDQQYGQQWGRRRQSRSPFWGSSAERGMNMGQDFAERGMEMGLRLAERRMEMEERLRRDWDGWRDQDWDQDRRRDGYRQNNRGNYDSRRDRSHWESVGRDLPIQTVYFFKEGNTCISRAV